MNSPKHRSGEPRLVMLPPTLESLGAVIHFLAVDETFGPKPLAGVVLEVMTQLKNKWHFCAIRENTVVGYCGWVFSTRELAESYLKDERRRDNLIVSPDKVDAAVLTIVRIPERQLVLPMMRAMRNHRPGIPVFFRREYFDSNKPKRSNTVVNMTTAENAPTAAEEAPPTITVTPSQR